MKYWVGWKEVLGGGLYLMTKVWAFLVYNFSIRSQREYFLVSFHWFGWKISSLNFESCWQLDEGGFFIEVEIYAFFLFILNAHIFYGKKHKFLLALLKMLVTKIK